MERDRSEAAHVFACSESISAKLGDDPTHLKKESHVKVSTLGYKNGYPLDLIHPHLPPSTDAGEEEEELSVPGNFINHYSKVSQVLPDPFAPKPVLQYFAVVRSQEHTYGNSKPYLKKFKIFLYLSDDTLCISELIPNAPHIVHQEFLKRQANKDKRTPPHSQTPILVPKDLYVGKIFSAYGHEFLIVGCDEQTRRYMSGISVCEGVSTLADEFAAGSDGFVRTHEELVAYSVGLPAECGKVAAAEPIVPRKVVNEGLGKLIENDREVLLFYCKLTSAEAPEGTRYILYYFLADNTGEILKEVKEKSCQKEVHKFSKRSKMYKNDSYDRSITSLGTSNLTLLTADDFYVGGSFEANGCKFEIEGTDEFTRQYKEGFSG